MNTKKVYLAQVNVTYNDYIAYLPYAAGCLAAYAWNDEEIKESFELADILYMRLTLEESFEKNQRPCGYGLFMLHMEHGI